MRAKGEDHDAVRISKRRHDVVAKPFAKNLDALTMVCVILLGFALADAPDNPLLSHHVIRTRINSPLVVLLHDYDNHARPLQVHYMALYEVGGLPSKPGRRLDIGLTTKFAFVAVPEILILVIEVGTEGAKGSLHHIQQVTIGVITWQKSYTPLSNSLGDFARRPPLAVWHPKHPISVSCQP